MPDAPIALQKAFLTQATNPFQTQCPWLSYGYAPHDPLTAEQFLRRWAAKWADGGQKRSTRVKITLSPVEAGSPVTKSMAMCDHGLPKIGSGWSRLAGPQWDALLQA